MTRSFISPAALFVNVTAIIHLKGCNLEWEGSFKASKRYSLTRLKVLPEPAEDLYTKK
jgi:hypothetical protein